MFLYRQKSVQSEQIGRNVARVVCTHCGCEYYYQLTRTGTGSGAAPYGVGVGAATRSAEENSRRELVHRLTTEAELVPCPKCHWINEGLVQGYRRSRYRRLGGLAIGVAFFGTVISLICSWFISIGPAADRRALPYFLFGGPALFVSLAIALILLQFGLRRRIRPNRRFPLAPDVPPGTPPPLVRDPSTGEWALARVDNWDAPAPGGWYYVPLGEQLFPPRCCECLQDMPEDWAGPHQLALTTHLRVPHCEKCDRKKQRAFQRLFLSLTSLGSLAGCAAGAAIAPVGSYWFWVVAVSSAFFSTCLAVYVASVRTDPARVKVVDRTRCIAKVRFRNAEYGRVLAEHVGNPGGAAPHRPGESAHG